jgi:hypothetical protein
LYQPPAISPETDCRGLNIFKLVIKSYEQYGTGLVQARTSGSSCFEEKKPIPSEAGVLGIITLRIF